MNKFHFIWMNHTQFLDVTTEANISNFSILSIFLHCDMTYDIKSFIEVINNIDKVINRKSAHLRWGGNATFIELYEEECLIKEIFSSAEDGTTLMECKIDTNWLRKIIISWFKEMTKVQFKQDKLTSHEYNNLMQTINSLN